MHNIIRYGVATRPRYQPLRTCAAAAMPRVQQRQISNLQEFHPLVPGIAGSHAAAPVVSKAPRLQAQSRLHPLLPTHATLVKQGRARTIAKEVQRADPLQQRLAESLLDAACYERLAPELCEMLARTGLAREDAARVAGNMLRLLVEDRPLPGIERDLHALIDTLLIRSYTELTVAVALQHLLARKIANRLAQFRSHALGRADSPGAGIDWGTGLHAYAPYDTEIYPKHGARLARMPLAAEAGDAGIPAGRCDAVFSCDMLHRSADIDDSLRRMRDALQPGGRVCLLETVLHGATEREAEADRGRTLLHDYLLHRLLNLGDIPVTGNYLRRDEWPKRLRQQGFEVCNVVDLGIDGACPGNRDALYIAEKR
jgi:hypothetical protein